MLSDQTIDTFFQQHLPYRLGMLRAWRRHFANSQTQNHAVGICAYEASLIATRMFVSFLGIGLNRKTETLHCLQKKKEIDDVWIDDLGGLRPSDLKQFSPAEVAALTLIYKYTNRASAHLTIHADVIGSTSSSDRDKALVKSADALSRVVRQNLHDKTGRKWVAWDEIGKTRVDLLTRR